jgi:hypothetical protein
VARAAARGGEVGRAPVREEKVERGRRAVRVRDLHTNKPSEAAHKLAGAARQRAGRPGRGEGNAGGAGAHFRARCDWLDRAQQHLLAVLPEIDTRTGSEPEIDRGVSETE